MNGPVHVKCKVLQHVVTSATEVGMVGLFYNCQTVGYLYWMIEALGHVQRPTAVKIENGTASQLVTDTIKSNKVSHGMWNITG